MTPMIDIIFNLIIFFMLVSQVQQLEIENVTLPVSEASKRLDYTEYRNVVINIVKIPPDGAEVRIMGRPYDASIVEGGGELTQYLKMRAESEERGKLNVILRADADIRYEDVARVMLAAGAAGIEGWWITTEIED